MRQDAAERAGQTLFAADRASQSGRMSLFEVRPGYARIVLTVRPEILDGHSTGHGGLIFTLADCAFTSGCKPYNISIAASDCSIDFLERAAIGDRLTAEATERILAGHSGIYDASITNQKDQKIAVFRGHSRQIGVDVV